MSQMKKKDGRHLVCVEYLAKLSEDTRHEFLDPQLPRNDKLYYLGDKTGVFFMSKKTAAILNL